MGLAYGAPSLFSATALVANSCCDTQNLSVHFGFETCLVLCVCVCVCVCVCARARLCECVPLPVSVEKVIKGHATERTGCKQ